MRVRVWVLMKNRVRVRVRVRVRMSVEFRLRSRVRVEVEAYVYDFPLSGRATSSGCHANSIPPEPCGEKVRSAWALSVDSSGRSKNSYTRSRSVCRTSRYHCSWVVQDKVIA